MESINILLVTPAGKDFIKNVEAVDPRIKITDASHLMPIWPPPAVVTENDAANEAELDKLLKDTEIIAGFNTPRNCVTRAPKLKWIQILAAGVERQLTPEIIASDVIMTNASGAGDAAISEMAFTMILMLAKNSASMLEDQKNHVWLKYSPTVIKGLTLGILGLGAIGSAVARLGKGFGMKVLATHRSAQTEETAPNVDIVYPPQKIDLLLKESDFVVAALPFTVETDKIIGEKYFSQMKPTAYFINMGRGGTVDQDSLIQALKDKKIAGAGLDTVAIEPLPADSPLWDMPNVIISPHTAGVHKDHFGIVSELFCDNLRRYIEGKEMRNVVNKKLGY